jgi:hypothetical protein
MALVSIPPHKFARQVGITYRKKSERTILR